MSDPDPPTTLAPQDDARPARSGGQRLAGESVLVTGGAQGIGQAIAALAVREGATVRIVDVQPVSERDGVAACVADVSDREQVRSAVAEPVERVGDFSVLDNNAGRNCYGDAVSMSDAEWDVIFAVDLKSAFLCSKAVLPAMIRNRRGSIVNVASRHAQLTMKGMFPYAAAKSGLVGLTRTLALDMAEHGIRVNSVSPGYIRTPVYDPHLARSDDHDAERRVLDVHPLGRFGTPEDVAEVVCFLASSAASYVTGSDWAVDGGLGARFA